MDADIKFKYFQEWLNNGGKLTFSNLIEDYNKITFKEDGKVNPESISSGINSAMLSVIATHLENPHFDGKKLSEYISILQKEHYFDQINIETEKDFDEFYNKEIKENHVLYRGVKESKWRLYNSLQRHWILNNYVEKDIDYKNFNKELVNNARTQSNNLLTKFLKINGILPQNDIAILSFLQHYGSPTPLLDWTYNLNTALFFATENLNNDINFDIDNYFSVYILEEKYLVDSSLRKVANKVLSDLETRVKDNTSRNAELEGISKSDMEKFFSPNRLKLTTRMLYGKPVITKASSIDGLFIYPMAYFSDNDENDEYLIPFSLNNNLNVVNQEGVFLFNNDPIKSLEENCMDQYRKNNPEEDNYRFSKCININKSIGKYVIKKLKENFIDKNYIFPDPYQLASQIFRNTTK